MPGLWCANTVIPRINRDYGDPGFGKKKETAGTKQRCVVCGTPTYRSVGPDPVCSFCTNKVKTNWKKRI